MIFKMFVGINVTKPESFVGGHRINNLILQFTPAVSLERAHQFAEGAELMLFQ